jgi:hypothetical protein
MYTMRYHKANEITKPEADSLIAAAGTAMADIVVISHGDRWYDVRAMTRSEIEAFVTDLARAEIAAEQEKTSLPN